MLMEWNLFEEVEIFTRAPQESTPSPERSGPRHHGRYKGNRGCVVCSPSPPTKIKGQFKALLQNSATFRRSSSSSSSSSPPSSPPTKINRQIKVLLQNNAMFRPSSSPPADSTLLPAFCCPATAPQTFYDSGSSHPPFFSSSSPPYSSSFPSYYLQRSSSSHSLSLHQGIPDQPPFLSPPRHHHHHPPPPTSSPPTSSPGDCFGLSAGASSGSGSVRRVFSTGDLQGMNVMQAPGDKYNQESAAIPVRIGRCSAEERKEKIGRYKSKRTHRNFQKKITYACRKTLADSRPRVRGRFARNGEAETETEPEVEIEVTENGYFLHRCDNNHEQAPNDGNEEWLMQMQAMMAKDGEEKCSLDDDILANVYDAFSMSFLS